MRIVSGKPPPSGPRYGIGKEPFDGFVSESHDLRGEKEKKDVNGMEKREKSKRIPSLLKATGGKIRGGQLKRRDALVLIKRL